MRIHTVLATLAIAIAVTGCNSVPILNVDQAPAISASGKSLSREQVRSAIVRAGAGLGWQMKDEGPNMIVGNIQVRNHTATVAIPYNANSYSIKYRASAGLDEKGGSIHKNYNGWVQNLTRSINAQLAGS
jgi:hypothetical protein